MYFSIAFTLNWILDKTIMEWYSIAKRSKINYQNNLIDKYFIVKIYNTIRSFVWTMDFKIHKFFIDENVEISWRTKEMDLINFFK